MEPGEYWRLDAFPGVAAWEQDALSQQLGGSPALSLALIQPGSGARREYVAMGGGCSLVPSTNSI